MVKCDFVCDIEELVLLLCFEPSEVFSACKLGYHRIENVNNLILDAQIKLVCQFTTYVQTFWVLPSEYTVICK